MDVEVGPAGRQEPAFCIDCLYVVTDGDRRTDFGDTAILADQHIDGLGKPAAETNRLRALDQQRPFGLGKVVAEHQISFARRGSRRSRRPSPTSCSDNTVMTIAAPGNIMIQAA